MDFKQGYRPFYAELYELHKKYFDIKTDTQWRELVAESKSLSEKYHSDFVDNMLSVVFDEIEGRCNGSK